MLFNAILKIFHDLLPTDNPDKAPPGEAEIHFAPGCCILVVDDNRTNLFITRVILEEAGAAVVLAEDGKAGLEAFQSAPNRFSAILMDLHMPVMNGYEATARIRETDRLLPIIALTADAVTGVEETCRAAGFTGCVQKPFEPEQLLQTLSTEISRVRPVMDPSGAISTPGSPAMPPLAAPSSLAASAPMADSVPLAAAMPADQEQSMEMLSLPLLDEADGLRRLGNRRDVYETILVTFLQEAEEEFPKLTALVANKHWDEVVKSAHKIKGIAGNVGAKRLQAQVAELQQSALAGDPSLENTAAVRTASIRKTLELLREKISGVAE